MKPTGRPAGRPAKPLRPRTRVKLGRLSFAPLYDELKARHLVTARQVGEFYGVSKAQVSRWCLTGIGTFTADWLAIKLGLLPVVVWGDDFFDEDLLAFDARAKGDQQKFTDAQVRLVRDRFAAGERIFLLAREFGCGPMAISNIVHGRSYRSVA